MDNFDINVGEPGSDFRGYSESGKQVTTQYCDYAGAYGESREWDELSNDERVWWGDLLQRLHNAELVLAELSHGARFDMNDTYHISNYTDFYDMVINVEIMAGEILARNEDERLWPQYGVRRVIEV